LFKLEFRDADLMLGFMMPNSCSAHQGYDPRRCHRLDGAMTQSMLAQVGSRGAMWSGRFDIGTMVKIASGKTKNL
jgi:hypothetical protein